MPQGVMKKYFILILAASCFISVQLPAQEKKVNRQVLILDFVNQQKSKETGYLVESIAEAMIQPLTNTGSFDVLSRDTSKQVIEHAKLKNSDLFSDAKATEIGKTAGAEVVVIGNFVTVRNKVRIQAKAIDVLSGRVAIQSTVTSRLDGSIFENIDKLASEMSGKMKSGLPPIERRMVFKEKIIFKGEKNADKKDEIPSENFLSISGGGLIALPDYDKPFTFGYSGKVMIGANLFFEKAYFIIQGGIGQTIEKSLPGGLSTGYKVTSMNYYYGHGGMYLPWRFPNFVFRPFVTFGAHNGSIKPEPIEKFLMPSAEVGIMADYRFLGITLSSILSNTTIYDPKKILNFVSLHLGVSFAL